MMNQALMLAMILSLITPKTVSACSFDNESVGEPNITWTKRSVRVCWLTGAVVEKEFAKNDFKPELKKAVQQIVQKEYTLDRTGIEFIGWDECTNLKESEFDLPILQDDYAAPTNKLVQGFRKGQIEGYAILGQGGDLENKSKTIIGKDKKKVTITKRGFFKRNKVESVMYLSYKQKYDNINGNFKSVEELQFTALHELGHVAGLRHEHARAEAKTDPNCKVMGDFKVTEQLYDTAKIYGSYDPNSIMNYCWGNTLLAYGKLYETLPNMSDETLVSKIELMKVETKVDEKTGEKTFVKTPVNGYKIRLGLSQQDIKTLNAMYP